MLFFAFSSNLKGKEASPAQECLNGSESMKGFIFKWQFLSFPRPIFQRSIDFKVLHCVVFKVEDPKDATNKESGRICTLRFMFFFLEGGVV